MPCDKEGDTVVRLGQRGYVLPRGEQSEELLNLKRSLTLVFEPSIVLRGLKFSIIVGSILVLINHGDRLFTDRVTPTQMVQILFTYIVPFLVSSLSSIQSIVAHEETQGGAQ